MDKHLYSCAAGVNFLSATAHALYEWAGNDALTIADSVLFLPTNRSRRAFARLWAAHYPNSLMPHLLVLGQPDDLLEYLQTQASMLMETQAVTPPVSALLRSCMLAELIQKAGISQHRDAALRLAESVGQLLNQMTHASITLEDIEKVIPDELSLHRQATLALLQLLLESWPEMLAEQGKQEPTAYYCQLMDLCISHCQNAQHAPVILAGSTLSQGITQRLADALYQTPHGYVILPGYNPCTQHIATAEGLFPMHSMQKWVQEKPVQMLSGAKKIAPHYTLALCEGFSSEVTYVTQKALTFAQKEQHVAIVTPNYYTQQRVAHALLGQGIVLDNAAGTTLLDTLPGRYMVACETLADQPSVLALLCWLQHPYVQTACTEMPESHRVLCQALESGQYAAETVESVLQTLSPLADIPLIASMQDYLNAPSHQCLKTVLTPHAHPANQRLIALLDELSAFSQHWPARDVLRRALYHPPLIGGAVPIVLLTPMEARLLSFDAVFIMNLNQEDWPGHTQNPWLSQHMLAETGLQSSEMMQHIAAHDLHMLLHSARTYCTRAKKQQGRLAIASVFWQQLALSSPVQHVSDKQGVLVHQPLVPEAPVRPATLAFPKVLYVTHIELLMRDPFGFFAKHILGLKPKPCLEDDNAASQFGNLVHDVLEQFSLAVHQKGQKPTYELAKSCYQAQLAHYMFSSTERLLLVPRIERVIAQAIALEEATLDKKHAVYAELEGAVRLPQSGVVLKARADRVEQKGHQLFIYDYKTGQLPKTAEMRAHLSPQLPLEAYLALKGGFALPHAPKHVSVQALKMGNFRHEAAPQPITYTQEEAETYAAVIDATLCHYMQEGTVFSVSPEPKYAPAYNDYAHLERIGDMFA